jgi:uncharacterized protein (DUF2141 family)
LKDRKILIGFLIFCFPIVLSAQSNTPQTGKLIITFTDIRSDIGNIVMGLYNAEEQWTDNPEHSLKWNKSKLKNGKLTVEIDSLPRTTYACAVLDDEDKSISMNFFLGLPREGWGMSTNPSFLKLKKPKFKEVSFDLDCPVLRIELKMNYLNKKKKVK